MPGRWQVTALLIALYLSRPLQYVEVVYAAAERANVDPVLACALVEWESGFDPTSWDTNSDGSTDYGLFRLCSRYFYQYRESIERHCAQGAAFLMGCLMMEGGDEVRTLARYNAGSPTSETGRRYAARVLAIRDRIKETVR